MTKNGFTVLFLHGDLQNSSVFFKLENFFRGEGFETLIADLPGHGDSKISDENKNLISFIDSLLKDKEEKNLFIVGHSSGALLGLEYARLRNNISGMILINPLLTNPKFMFPGLELKLIFENLIKQSKENFVNQDFVNYSLLKDSSDDLLKSLGMKTTSPLGFQNNINFYSSIEIENFISETESPILVIASKEDKIIPFDFIRNSIENQSNVRLVQVEGDHNLPIKSSDLLVNQISENLDLFSDSINKIRSS